MLKNLSAEMVRNGVKAELIASVLGVSDRTIRSKLSGDSEFSFAEAEKIRDEFFPSLRLEYLFRNSPSTA